MNRNYKNTMDKITVDDEMKKRILKNVSNMNDKDTSSRNIKRNFKSISILVAAACFSIIVSTVNVRLNLNHKINKPSDNSTKISTNQTQDKNDESSNANIVDSTKDEDSKENIELNNKPSSQETKDKYNKNLESSNSLNNDKINKTLSYSKKEDVVHDEKNIETKIETNIKEEIESNIKSREQLEDNIKNDSKMRTQVLDSGHLEKNFNSLQELNSNIDFSIKTPKNVVEDKDIQNISLKENNNILINYENSKIKLELHVSKEEYKKENDNNPIYNMQKELNVNDKIVLIQGHGDNINSAKWYDEDLSYSINCNDGVNEENAIKIIESVE